MLCKHDVVRSSRIISIMDEEEDLGDLALRCAEELIGCLNALIALDKKMKEQELEAKQNLATN